MAARSLTHPAVVEHPAVVLRLEASRLRVSTSTLPGGAGVLVVAVDDKAIEIGTSASPPDVAARGLEELATEAYALARLLYELHDRERVSQPEWAPEWRTHP
jgi:hypothetical protein